MSAAWVGVQRICHDKWGDANSELKHIWLTPQIRSHIERQSTYMYR